MATITGLTAARMLIIEAMSVISGAISGNDLILTRQNGTTINAGNVRGPTGPQGIPGTISSSPAGGDLAGNYPNPTIGDGKVTPAKLSVPSLPIGGTTGQYLRKNSGTNGDAGWDPGSNLVRAVAQKLAVTTGIGSLASNVAQINHGLSAVPSMIIVVVISHTGSPTMVLCAPANYTSTTCQVHFFNVSNGSTLANGSLRDIAVLAIP